MIHSCPSFILFSPHHPTHSTTWGSGFPLTCANSLSAVSLHTSAALLSQIAGAAQKTFCMSFSLHNHNLALPSKQIFDGSSSAKGCSDSLGWKDLVSNREHVQQAAKRPQSSRARKFMHACEMSVRLSHTQAPYHKEAHSFLLVCICSRSLAFSSMILHEQKSSPSCVVSSIRHSC